MTPGTSPLRRAIERASLALGLGALGWAALLAASGGFDVTMSGIRIASHDPLKALLAAALALAVFVLGGGSLPDVWIAAAGRLQESNPHRLRSRPVAWALAAAMCGIGIVYSTKAIGGSDSYGYVSQADQWLAGRLKIDQSFALDAPWPQPDRTFAPLGYTPDTSDRRFIVPGYPPGFPLLLAGAKWLGGQDGVFCVVPLAGALLVLATYGLGRRLGSGLAGVIGAWLVATSPPVLFMMVTPMTDVPIAGVAAAAAYLLLGTSAWSAAGAGLLSGLAILIRPNFLPLAAILGTLLLLRVDAGRRRALGHACLYALGVLPGMAIVAAVNKYLYGSPLTSGYGMPDLFTASHLLPNLRNYLHSLIDTHTPIVLSGFVALFVPLRAFWPGVRDRRVFIAIALFVLAIWTMYCAFNLLDTWWYLRYLLATWPFIMIGVGAVAAAILRRSWPIVRLAVAGAVVALGVVQLHVAADRSTFVAWQGERRYIVAAQLTGRVTPPNSVVMSGPHVGSIRYYGGRMTMRYDEVHPAWFDRVIDWLGDRGVRTYLAVENWEIPEIRDRFAGARHLAALDRPPLAVYAEPGHLLIFELSDPPDVQAPTVFATGIDTGIGWRATPPVAAPRLVFSR